MIMKIAVPWHNEHASFPPFRNGRHMMLLGGVRGPPVDLCGSVLNYLFLTPSLTLRTQIIEQTINPTSFMKMAFPCHSRHASLPPFRNGRDMMLLGDHRSRATGWPLRWLHTWTQSGPDNLTYILYTNNWALPEISGISWSRSCRFLSWRFVFCHGTEQTLPSCLARGTPKSFKWRQTLLWQADSSSGSLIQYCQYFT